MKFEYRIERIFGPTRVEQMNSLGKEDWELVAILPPNEFVFKKTYAHLSSKDLGTDEKYGLLATRLNRMELDSEIKGQLAMKSQDELKALLPWANDRVRKLIEPALRASR